MFSIRIFGTDVLIPVVFFSKKRRNACTKDVNIESSILQLFGAATSINSDHSWPFINELALQSVTLTQNMMASNFHNQLYKAAKREIIIFEYKNQVKIEKKLKFEITNNFVRSLTCSQHESNFPLQTPTSLLIILNYLIQSWKERFQIDGKPLECPTESFIYNQHVTKGSPAAKEKGRKYLGIIFKWMYDLQEHRTICIKRLQSIIPSTENRSAACIFGKTAKALGVLPVFSFNVLHVGITRDNGLQSLCKLAEREVIKDFHQVFPGKI